MLGYKNSCENNVDGILHIFLIYSLNLAGFELFQLLKVYLIYRDHAKFYNCRKFNELLI